MGRVKPKRKAPVTADLPGVLKKSGYGSSAGAVSKDLVHKLALTMTRPPNGSSAALSILGTLAQDTSRAGTATETTSITSSLLTVKGSSSAARKKSSLATAQLIRKYHTLNKELSKCLARVDKRIADNSQRVRDKGHGQDSQRVKGKGQGQDSQRSKGKGQDAQAAKQDTPLLLTGKAKEEHEADLARILEIRQEMENLGGLDMYQKASTLGQSKQRGGDSSRWLVPILQRIYFPETSDTSAPPSKQKRVLDPPLRLLDVGALSPFNYEKQGSWIQVTPIDLNPQHPQIQKMDFLEMPIPTRDQDRYDIVCLSLVVNFVGDPVQRGEILRQATRCLVPQRGILYLVLPLPCIDNSRYMDHELLVDMMHYLGCSTLLDHHFAKKLAYYAFRFDGKSPPPPSSSASSIEAAHPHRGHRRPNSTATNTNSALRFPKKLRHDKPNRNNFCIVLQ